MMVFHAGYSAEMRVTARSPTYVFDRGSRPDFEELADYAIRCWSDYQDKVDQSCAEAEKLLDAHWKVVEAVAEALLEKKTLSGKRVRRVVMENGGKRYLVRGGLKTAKCNKKNEAGDSVEFRPTMEDTDYQVTWHEVPMTVELWKK